MQPSSLIFLVIVAIWVAYLIQHWVSRREHLATARSVDRFSEAMRVLERRSPLPTTMLATGSTGSGSSGSFGPGSSGPASGARPEVVVKRASVSSPLRARTAVRGEAGPVHEVPPIELVPHRTTAQIVLRRVRAILFLAALVAVPATITLSALHILKWLSVGLAVAGLLVAVVWLRVAAMRDLKVRRARRAELRRLEQLRAGGAARPTKQPAAEPVRPAVAPAPQQVSERVAERVSVADIDPDAWQPVPVPPPTYTLKEPAHRSEPASWPPSGNDTRESGMRPVPIEVEDDDIEIIGATQGRRVVGH